MMHKTPHDIFEVRVYYEDTDLAKVVYYANYLKFIERARSEYLRKIGIDQNSLHNDGLVFVVSTLECRYISPAYYDDRLRICTHISAVERARIVLEQNIWREDKAIFTAALKLAMIDLNTKRPARIPAAIRERFAKGA